ncbi:MAG: hypothetical protein ACXVCY_10805 [Pseudobdellovibrionaceae bacterium]
MIRFIFPILLMFATAAQARVFNINNEAFAAYFAMTGGGSSLGTSAVDDESGTGIKFTGGMKYNYTGEFGFLYAHPLVGLRFGFELIKPFTMESTANNGTSDVYSLTSTIVGYAPKLTVDLNIHRTETSRSFVTASVGSASVTMTNEYTLTSAGQTAFPGVSNHTAESKGSGTLLEASLGYEGILTDTTTMLIEFGYRQLKIGNLKYEKDVTTFTGAKGSGTDVLNSSGVERSLDLSGAFVSLGFRFYM